MRRFTIFLLLAAAVAATPGAARAWNKPGHMVSAALAYHDLVARHPDVAARVVTLLRSHPYYAQWRDSLRTDSTARPADEPLFLFMWAARWPDDARGTQYAHDDWHFINYPFKPAGQPDSIFARPPKSPNVVRALYDNLRILRNRNRPARDRAIALAWLFHMYGDVHQPLHTTALFSTLYPNGDQGGNLIWVRPASGARATRLHSAWDGLVLNCFTDCFGPVNRRVLEIRGQSGLQRRDLPELRETSYDRWAKPESYDYAVSRAYLDGNLPMSADSAGAQPLPSGYLNTATQVAERRMATAGYRLADLLRLLF